MRTLANLLLFTLAVAVLSTCAENTGPEVGVAVIEVSTTGPDQDIDGYFVIVDEDTTLYIEPDGALELSGLDPGGHVVRLGGVSPNCDPHPVSGILEFNLSAGQTTHVRYLVACFATGLLIQSRVTGLDHGSWFAIRLDGPRRPEVVPVAGSVEIHSLSPGAHEVRLDVPANCVVTPESRTVEVPLRVVIAVEFETRCAAAYGLLEVRVASSGDDLDLAGFKAAIDERTYLGTAANGISRILLEPGSHDVRLQDVAGNCTVTGGDHRTATTLAGRPSRDTTIVSFEVACVRQWELAFSREGFIALATADGLEVDIGPDGVRPTWSPDGTRLAWACWTICIATLSTGETWLMPSDLLLSGPAWSPDGTQMVFVGAECDYDGYYYDYGCTFLGLFRRTPDGATLRIPLPQGVTAATDPAWSPDGSTIVFGCGFSPEEVGTLCSVATDGREFRRLLDSGGQEAQPAWSPDGSRLVLSTARFGSREIVTIRPDGTDLRRFEPPVFGSSPSWARDGRILFASRMGIRIMNADGSGNTSLTSVPADSLPALRPRP